MSAGLTAHLIEKCQSQLSPVLGGGQDGVLARLQLRLEDVEGGEEHGVVVHVLALQETLRLLGVAESLVDPTKYDGRLANNLEVVLHINVGKKSSVHIGVGIAASRHYLEGLYEGLRGSGSNPRPYREPHPSCPDSLSL